MSATARLIIGDSRLMPEVAADAVDLVVTSPPYWHLKDYGVPGQIGYGQSLHDYLCDLYRVWRECRRVLRPGGRLCVNIGDQFARAAVYGRYKIIPLHAEIICQGEELGLDFLGSIIWQKKTTMHTTGGAVIMGSYPFPPNGLVEIDYEHILIFKKPGESKKVARELKEAARLTKEEWKEYFAGHWRFGGARQLGHEAMFPEELPRRLIRMFTFPGDTVLDPFLGSGTTVKAALDLGRHGVGYEVNEAFLGAIREKLGLQEGLLFARDIDISTRKAGRLALPPLDYTPRLQDAKPQPETKDRDFKPKNLQKVVQIVDESTIRLESGRLVKFLGVIVQKKEEAMDYLTSSLLGKSVIIKHPDNLDEHDRLSAYVYTKNKIFVNSYLIKSGLAAADISIPHKYARKFAALLKESLP
ncbi:MAG: site-specific DNA-methyltransferase [Deltaproteobacteria bacterium]|nr:site-specific DNA-methyltransferase [Deltaproteobacteria bacterium]